MLHIEVRNLSYIVITNDKEIKKIIKDFMHKFKTYTMEFKHKGKGKFNFIKRDSYDYNAGNKLNDEHLFNITTIKDFMQLLSRHNIKKENITLIDKRKNNFEKIDLHFTKEVEDREYQSKYVKLILDKTDTPAKLVDLETGKGKGLISIKAIVEINNRVGIIVLPKYIVKWVKEIVEFTDLKEEDILTIQGGKELRKLMDDAKEGNEIPKIIIFSNRTILNYINEYESMVAEEFFSYSILPKNICEEMNMGTIVVDEVHQEYYSVFKSMLYFDPEYFIALSATLVTKDSQLKKMYKVLFPDKSRLSLLELSKYINVYAVSYSITRMYGIKFETHRGYNHIMFEQSIMRNSKLLKSYIDMIDYYLKKHYIDRKKKGEKAIVFIATIELCTILVDELKNRYPKIDIRRFIGMDPYENVIDSDIRVTTIKSAGTAIDIKGLITTIQTVSVNSEQANIQALGRLRDIKGRDMEFVYLWCEQIKKQERYHHEKISLYRPRVKRIFLDRYQGTVTT